MTIAAFVDPGDQDRDLALELAIAIAEYSIAENRILYLLSDAPTALEIGIALLGMRDRPPIEDGEYRGTSPIKLLEFLDTSDADQNDVGDDVEALRQLGLFADRDNPETEVDLTRARDVVFNDVIERADLIIGLGINSDIWGKVFDMPFIQKVVSIEGYTPDAINGFTITTVRKNENARNSIRSDFNPNNLDLDDAESSIEDIRRTEEEVKQEQEGGLLVAALLDFLIRSSA